MPKWLINPPREIFPNLTEDELHRVTRWIDQAERLISTRFTTIQTRIDAGHLDQAVVGDVVEAMVTRALATHRRGGMDKLSYPEVSMEWSTDGGAGTGSTLFLTMDELLLLAPSESQSAWTIRRKPTPRTPW